MEKKIAMLSGIGAAAVVVFSAVLFRKEIPALYDLYRYRSDPAGPLEVVRSHDTIVVGRMKSLGLRPPDDTQLWQRLERGWALTFEVEETLQGRSLAGNAITLFIHSPSMEFNLDVNGALPQELWVWALKYEGGSIVDYGCPGIDNYDPARIDLFRRAVRLKRARYILGL